MLCVRANLATSLIFFHPNLATSLIFFCPNLAPSSPLLSSFCAAVSHAHCLSAIEGPPHRLAIIGFIETWRRGGKILGQRRYTLFSGVYVKMLYSWFLICFCCGSVWVAWCLTVLVGMHLIKDKKTRLGRAQKTNICSLFYCIITLVVLTGDYLLYAGPLDCALLVFSLLSLSLFFI